MIVKNEAHIIASTLENLCNYVHFDYWVIVDTGSTDDTKQVIRDFFESKNIKGELHETEWKNFGFNRSDALSKAFNKTDYLFVFDADDRIVGDFILPLDLNKDGYHLKFGDNFSYIRLLFVNNRLHWKFMGVLHEYITCTNENYNCILDNIDGNYHLVSGKSGARSNNPNKYRDDALILEKAYKDAVEMKDDIMVRYSFYCAQSYKDDGNAAKAIQWYKKRISHGGWNQEVYYSYITIGQLYAEMNNIESAFYYWTLSFDADPERCEGIYYIIKRCREKGNFNLAYHYYKWVEKNKTSNLLYKLFVTEDIYKYLLDYEFTIIACYVGQHKHAIPSFHTLFKYANEHANALSIGLKENIVHNLQFYTDFIDSENLQFFYDYLAFVKQIYLETGSLKKHIVDITDKMKDKFAPLSSSSDYSYSSKNVQLHDDGVELHAAGINMKELLQKYDCYPGQDFFGSDILHIGNKSLFDQLLTAEKMSDCVCFNTLGYFKKEMDVNRMKNLNGCNLYVKKKYLLEKKNSCNKIKQNIIKCKKYKSSKKILFYVGYSQPEYRWNKTTSLTTPTGGSEKALSYLIEKFPKNYDIYVCGDVIEEECGNIHFVNSSKIKNIVEENEFHTVILSRYIEFIVNHTFKCYKLYVWAHDTCIRSLSEKNNDANKIIKCCIDKIDGCICLTNWHKEYFSKQYTVLENKFFTINNGIELNHFPEPQPKIKNTFVYTSRSERGLQRVLELWESISKNITDAHLSISSYNVFPDPNNKNDFILEHEIKKYSNVDHLGKLNEKELYDLMNKSEFWIYPTNFLETSCITAMEMLKSRVICLYYPIGGLVDTINGNGIQLIRDEEVNQIMNLTEDEKQTIIENGERYANTCSWENRCNEWENQLFRVEHANENTNNKIKVVNLLRRMDRRDSSIENFKRANITNYEFVEAVDGKALTPNSELISLFKGNNFGNRRGVIGCALTHYNLWKKLLESEFEYFIIMEDDFTIVESFKEEIEKIDFEKYDILLMGYHMFSKTLEKVKDIYRNCNENKGVNLTIDRLQMDYYIGGIHCYSINKNGARKLLDYINKNGIKRAIDCFFNIPELECFETRPHISFAEWSEGGKAIDSDIQNIYDSIDLSDTDGDAHADALDGLLQKYDCYPGQDFFGSDILHIGNKSLFDQLLTAEKMSDCACFNTLGYFKKEMDVNRMKNLNGCNLYVKKKYLLEKKNVECKSERKFNILNLILFSNENCIYREYYLKIVELQKEYMKSYKSNNNNITFYFYCYKEDLQEEYMIEDDMIYIKGTETYVPGILEKTIKAFEITKNMKYDFLLRSNISTVIDYRKLDDILYKIPDDVIYAGGSCLLHNWLDHDYGIHKVYNIPFILGTSIILKREGVHKIINNKNVLPETIIDDVSLGLFFNHFGDKPYGFDSYYRYNLSCMSNDVIFYRNRISYERYNKVDKNIEIANMQNIIKQIMERERERESNNIINEKIEDLHSKLIIKYGTFNDELPEQKMVVRYLTGNEKVLEIGGNIGRNSLIIASILKDDTNFVTLECDKNIATQLKENRDLNNFKFHIENSALSKRNLIQKGWDTIPSDTLQEGYAWVNTITLNELKSKYRIEFDTLVLDCEGAFYYILIDMPEVLNDIKLIIMENDYYDISKKNYVDEVLIKNNFHVDYQESGGWGPCFNNFFEVWKKN